MPIRCSRARRHRVRCRNSEGVSASGRRRSQQCARRALSETRGRGAASHAVVVGAASAAGRNRLAVRCSHCGGRQGAGRDSDCWGRNRDGVRLAAGVRTAASRRGRVLRLHREGEGAYGCGCAGDRTTRAQREAAGQAAAGDCVDVRARSAGRRHALVVCDADRRSRQGVGEREMEIPEVALPLTPTDCVADVTFRLLSVRT